MAPGIASLSPSTTSLLPAYLAQFFTLPPIPASQTIPIPSCDSGSAASPRDRSTATRSALSFGVMTIPAKRNRATPWGSRVDVCRVSSPHDDPGSRTSAWELDRGNGSLISWLALELGSWATSSSPSRSWLTPATLAPRLQHATA
ncbi:hypothetical protein BKA56DRAFT_617612 [Ilyonectria sp. MPI-CAGE-AT-0026]|nr:hypothetical protein BKA56DRAFT_617612 [Ilyonectria sp. MPI-CAGE-AT-0026]